ncbi:MAG: TetR/AcrR family transcriptional regulator [Bacteroidetes bacterium]|nr:MAG: TetR/AcrR family transcriptional regulator [Bacteroidota bacterium]
MGIAERRLRQKEEIRAIILDTAWEMVKKEGWQSLSIRKIAEAIEYSVPVIYDHFENKEAILLEFTKQGFQLLFKKLEKAQEKYDDPAAKLTAIADTYWDFAFKNKEYYQLMFGLGMACCEFEATPETMAIRKLTQDIINELIGKNKVNSTNSCLKYHTFWSVLHGLISIKMMRKWDVTDEVNKLVVKDAISGFIKNLQN